MAFIGIDGTARKIKGAFIGVDGVARKVKKAYVGVDGVARLCWSDAPAGVNVKVTLENSGLVASQTSSMYSYFTLDGVRHAVAEELVVPIGTVLNCYCSRGQLNVTAKIYLNGAEVSYTTNNQYNCTYDYTVTGDVEVKLCNSVTMSSGTGYVQQISTTSIYITEL